MKFLTLLATLFAITLLLGCAEPETYPITGLPCGPDDPVKDLDAADCTVP